MRSLALVFFAACTTHTVSPAPVKVKNVAIDYARVAPSKIHWPTTTGDDQLDGKRIAVTALVPPTGAQLVPASLVWEGLPILKMTRGAIDPPPQSDEYRLVTVSGRYKKGGIEPRGITSVLIWPQLEVDRFEAVPRRPIPTKSDGLLVADEPEHVILDGVYGHGEERSAIDGTIWLTGCPTRPPDGPVRVDGWLFGKRGSYGHMNRYVFLLVANRCEAR